MNKVKLNSGLGAMVLVACLFAGWQTLLIVSILMLLFCEMDEKISSIMTRVISFLIVITLISLGWSVITEVFDLLFSTIEKFVSLINCYADTPTTLIKFNRYFATPVETLISLVGSFVSFGITISKFIFIVFVLMGKQAKDNFISKKVKLFISKVSNFVNTTNAK